ncbi:hypothetical protein T492DRAFT_1071734 [Pavlovales sp. CCMP2436]|nr:hypothetical protein T492DRAFT_1071734 [Pavlovales sp. CCMP2436]
MAGLCFLLFLSCALAPSLRLAPSSRLAPSRAPLRARPVASLPEAEEAALTAARSAWGEPSDPWPRGCGAPEFGPAAIGALGAPAALGAALALGSGSWLAQAAPLALGSGSWLAQAAPLMENAGTVFDPSNFQPVCGTSDGVYRTLQGIILAMVGDSSYREYAPLIAGSLLRVRLELCVVESFFQEAIAPFIRERGLTWVLPLHETVETFLAGVVFAVATNFILIGSTKIVTVLVTYTDVFLGFPVRLVSGAAWDSVAKSLRPKREPPPPPASALEWVQRALFREEESSENFVDTLKAAGGLTLGVLLLVGTARVAGGASKAARQSAEALDTFVGRYLLLTTVAYVGVKFVHFKIFPDLF